MAEAATVRSKRKQRKGVVVENKMHKTIVVRVERVMRHPTYGANHGMSTIEQNQKMAVSGNTEPSNQESGSGGTR